MHRFAMWEDRYTVNHVKSEWILSWDATWNALLLMLRKPQSFSIWSQRHYRICDGMVWGQNTENMAEKLCITKTICSLGHSEMK